MRKHKLLMPMAGAVAMVLALAACSQESGPTASDGTDSERTRIGVFALATANAFAQAQLEGVEAAVAADGNAEVTQVFDGAFDGNKQIAQVEDAVATGRFDGFIVFSNDAAGMGTAVAAAEASGIPVVAAYAAIGPDPANLEPQVPGVVATVAVNPERAGTLIGEAAAEACIENHSAPCKVHLLTGCTGCTDDGVRVNAIKEALREADIEIEIVGESETSYSIDQGYVNALDALTRTPDLDVFAGTGSQHTLGAVRALEELGLLGEVDNVDAGAAIETAELISKGAAYASVVYLPREEGAMAVDLLLSHLRGEPHDIAVDVLDLSPIGPLLTQKSPTFEPAWRTG